MAGAIMCLPDFQEFRQIDKDNPLTGYRTWRNLIKDSTNLISEHQNYIWNPLEGPHVVTDVNSGIYAYNYHNYNYNNYNNNYNNYNNNYNNYYNYNYHNYNYNYYHNNNYNDNNYYLSGIIRQWGKVAIHSEGYRSEYAKVNTLFLIRESNAKGSVKFLDWIKLFNDRISKIAEKYEAKVISWQDFIEQNK